MKLKLQFAAVVLALGLGAAFPLPSAAQQPHYAAQRPANAPAHPRAAARQAARQQARQQARQEARQQNPRNGGQNRGANGGQNGGPQNGAANRGQTTPDWNRPAGGTPHSDRPPSANVPPPRYNNLSPQDKQRVFNNYRALQKTTPAQRQQLQDRAAVWNRLTPEQKYHIKNDVLPRWNQMPAERRRAIQNRLGVLQNMPEAARNQHLNDPNFTRGMSDEDRSTLRDLSHLHVGAAPDSPHE